MTYDVTNHALLSEAALTLRGTDPNNPSSSFLELVDDAEGVLNLAGTTYTGAQAKMARIAVVYQLNFFMALDADSDVLTSEGAGPIRRSYRQSLTGISPSAQAMLSRIEKLKSVSSYSVLKSLT